MSDEARALFAVSPVARLATAGPDGQPHLVAVCFALDGDRLVTAVDWKPKRSTRLKRLDNVRRNPRACALVDHYEDDWSSLWWARADGRARVVEAGEPGHAEAIDRLADRYPQYGARPPQGPVIELSVDRWSAWRARR